MVQFDKLWWVCIAGYCIKFSFNWALSQWEVWMWHLNQASGSDFHSKWFQTCIPQLSALGSSRPARKVAKMIDPRCWWLTPGVDVNIPRINCCQVCCMVSSKNRLLMRLKTTYIYGRSTLPSGVTFSRSKVYMYIYVANAWTRLPPGPGVLLPATIVQLIREDLARRWILQFAIILGLTSLPILLSCYW